MDKRRSQDRLFRTSCDESAVLVRIVRDCTEKPLVDARALCQRATNKCVNVLLLVPDDSLTPTFSNDEGRILDCNGISVHEDLALILAFEGSNGPAASRKIVIDFDSHVTSLLGLALVK